MKVKIKINGVINKINFVSKKGKPVFLASFHGEFNGEFLRINVFLRTQEELNSYSPKGETDFILYSLTRENGLWVASCGSVVK